MNPSPFVEWPRFEIDRQGRAVVGPNSLHPFSSHHHQVPAPSQARSREGENGFAKPGGEEALPQRAQGGGG